MRDRVVRVVRTVWTNLGVLLLVLAVLEGAFQVVFILRDRARSDQSVVSEDRLEAANPGQAWVREYQRELQTVLREEWRPYVYWRLRAYRSEYINIDEKGIRRTWNRSTAPSPNLVKIFVLGGSTTWGYGARDEFTIPSLVSKTLADRLPAAPWVTNFGETGYVNTQEVMTLMLELRKGNVPDIVVFYDGVNDAWAAFQSGVAGIPQNEINRIVEFNSRNRLNWRGGLVDRLALYRFTRGALGSFGSAGSGATRRFLDPALATSVVDVYLENVRIVKALAREYGFRAVFFWQPTIYSKNVLSAEEQRWRLTGSRRRGGPLFAEEYRAFNDAFRQRMQSSKTEGVYDLSGVFENDPRTIFLDRFHISEAGNEKVAGAVARIVQEIAVTVKK